MGVLTESSWFVFGTKFICELIGVFNFLVYMSIVLQAGGSYF